MMTAEKSTKVVEENTKVKGENQKVQKVLRAKNA